MIVWANPVDQPGDGRAAGAGHWASIRPNEGLMHKPPRPSGEGVITARMWRGIVFVGIVMAAGTLLVLDASVPGGLIEGAGDVRYGQTMAFTTLVLFQIFNVLNARSDEDSAFVHLFTNQWLRAAMGGSVALQAFVVYVPFLQRAFGTTALSVGDWLLCVAVASSGPVAPGSEQSRRAGTALSQGSTREDRESAVRRSAAGTAGQSDRQASLAAVSRYSMSTGIVLRRSARRTSARTGHQS